MRGAWGRAWGGTEHTEPPGKGQKGELWGTQDWGYGAGRRWVGEGLWGRTKNPTPRNSGPPSSTQSPSAHATFIGHGAMGHYSKGGMQQRPPPGLAPSNSSPHNSPHRGAAGEEGLWWGALPKLGAVGSELLGPPPALVVPEQRGGPQSFEPQIAARIK